PGAGVERVPRGAELAPAQASAAKLRHARIPGRGPPHQARRAAVPRAHHDRRRLGPDRARRPGASAVLARARARAARPAARHERPAGRGPREPGALLQRGGRGRQRVLAAPAHAARRAHAPARDAARGRRRRRRAALLHRAGGVGWSERADAGQTRRARARGHAHARRAGAALRGRELMSAAGRAGLLLAWLALLALSGWAVQRTLVVGADLRLFMPTPENEAQRLLLQEVGEGPGSRLLLLGI